MVEGAGVVVLLGPKAAGKSSIARLLAKAGGVDHVDPDVLVASLMAAHQEPDGRSGWLQPVEDLVLERLADHRWVAVEATGAWASDWALADRLEGRGLRVVRVWVTARWEETLRRLAERNTPTVRVSPTEARQIYEAAANNAAYRRFDAIVDTDVEEPCTAAQRVDALLR